MKIIMASVLGCVQALQMTGIEHLKIIASHDLDMILDTCERTILMADGKIICDGKTEDILSNKELLEENGLELPLCMQGRTVV